MTTDRIKIKISTFDHRIRESSDSTYKRRLDPLDPHEVRSGAAWEGEGKGREAQAQPSVRYSIQTGEDLDDAALKRSSGSDNSGDDRRHNRLNNYSSTNLIGHWPRSSRKRSSRAKKHRAQRHRVSSASKHRFAVGLPYVCSASKAEEEVEEEKEKEKEEHTPVLNITVCRSPVFVVCAVGFFSPNHGICSKYGGDQLPYGRPV
nr:uncharacterized protein CTRU02_02499 [Colletotrichum truncatum]KAF6798525.1 hypothetical protein CTRU02_02499 [Colletotrichum truncatum]